MFGDINLAFVCQRVVAFFSRADPDYIRPRGYEAASFYVEIVRGVPMLVILFYIAFVGAPGLVDLSTGQGKNYKGWD